MLSNYIHNFGGGVPATSSNGIITRAQWETDIEYNNVDNNDGFGVNQNSNLYGINVFNATNSNSITSNNVIKLQSGTTTGGQVYGIYNSINTGGNVPGFSTTINNNTIDMAQPLLTTVGNMRGIFCISSSQILTISNNVISGLSPFAFTGNAYGIFTQGTATTTTINNNSIKNFNRTAASGTTYGIYALGTAATTTATTGPTNVVANSNTIDNLTFTAADNTGIIYGINPSTNTITNTINNNIVKNLAVGTSGSIYGIYDNGIAGTKVCQNNQIFNFSTPAGGATGSNNSYFGIFFTNNAIAAFNVDISGNSIYSLNNSSTGTNGEIYGIYCTALQPSSIYKNKIYDLSYAGTNTSTNGWVSGIFALNNVSTIYNNTIADLRMPNYAQPAQKLFGIRVGNANLYYNTVFLNGTNASSAAVFSFTAGTLNLNNNIFINKVTPNTGGIASAYSRGDTTISTYNASSNNNLFAGTNIFYDGVNTDATLAAYKTRMAFRDQASVTEVTTPFTSTVGSNANFLQLPANAVSVANNAALPITSPAITTDYFGVTRSTTTPDIGASEFTGLVCTAPTVYAVSGGGNGCGSTGVPVGLVNSQTGVNYQLKLNGTATGGLVAGTGAALAFGNQPVAGTYTVDAISNVAGCTTPVAMSGSAVVTTSPAVTATTSQTNVSCFGGSNGSATVLAAGGTAPFTYSWSPSGGTSATTTGRTAGNYTCTITDALGCTAFRAFTITQPPALSTAASYQTNIGCNGASTGAAGVNPSGGTAPYAYLWTDGVTTNSISGVVAGNYTVTVTDANSCTATRSFTITQPPSLSNSSVVTNISCNGSSTGSINITVTGGTSPYTYNWGGGIVTEDRTGLPAGTYSVTITDANSCTKTQSFTITQPPVLSVTPVSQSNVACFGGFDGAASVSVSGGTPGYAYNWTPGTPTGDGTASVTNLVAGTWTCTVTDLNGCTASSSFTVTQPASAISGTTIITNVACNGGTNGAINLTPAGGVAPYTFNWGGGITTEDRTGLAAGTYSVTITDVNGCPRTVSGIIVIQPIAVSGFTSQTNVACFGGSTGAINLTPTGGTAPYTFNWGGGITTEDRTGLAAGTYSVTITDANGCTATNTNIISQPSAITATMSQTNVSCRTGSNGTATIVASGGAGSYTYSWSPSGGTGATATGLIAGTYTCTVTDANACSISRVYSITQPTAIAATITRTDVSCNSGANGSAVIVVSGGTGGYTYNWTPGNPTGNGTTSVSGLVAGSYTCTVTDVNGCIAARPFTITQPTAVSGTTVVTNTSCFGGSNGAINLTPSGGTAPYTYLWAGGVTTEDRTGLAAGTYSVTITDANSCTLAKSVTVTQPAALTATTSQTNVSCNSGANGTATISVSGGTSGYTYSWSPSGGTGATASGLIAGNYTCTITDANSCTLTKSITITQPAALTATTSQTNVSCNSGANGTATISVSGGTSGYTYSWSPSGGAGATASGLIAGNYTCTITDANSCTLAKSVTVTQPAAITPTFTQVAPICSGGLLDPLPTTSNNSITGTWSPALDNTTTTTYAFTPNSGQCGTTASMTITVNTTAQPTRDNSINGTLCNNATIGTLISKFNNSANVLCYAAASGGSPLSSSVLITPVNANVAFYLTQTIAGCQSTRVLYNAYVNFVTPPTAAASQSFCTGATVANLTATPGSAGGNTACCLSWYTTSSGGAALVNTTILTSGTYYVGQSHVSGCALERTLVNVTVSTVDNTITQTSGVLTATQSGASYQWYTCPNTLISGATNQTYTPTIIGDYKAEVTINDCTVTSNCLTVTTLGKADFENASFTYYPNPTDGILNVNYSSEISRIQVVNLLGQEVLSKSINSKEVQIDLQFLPSGTYLIKLTSSEKVKTIKIIRR